MPDFEERGFELVEFRGVGGGEVVGLLVVIADLLELELGVGLVGDEFPIADAEGGAGVCRGDVGAPEEGDGAIDGIAGEGGADVGAVDGAVVLVENEVALKPVWSPRDDMIFYMGSQERAIYQLRAVRSSGAVVAIGIPVELARNGEPIRLLPDGSGLICMQGNLPSKNFHLLDINAGEIGGSRRLTELKDSANSRSFDIPPDGKSIVFARVRDNSDVISIALSG